MSNPTETLIQVTNVFEVTSKPSSGKMDKIKNINLPTKISASSLIISILVTFVFIFVETYKENNALSAAAKQPEKILYKFDDCRRPYSLPLAKEVISHNETNETISRGDTNETYYFNSRDP